MKKYPKLRYPGEEETDGLLAEGTLTILEKIDGAVAIREQRDTERREKRNEIEYHDLPDLDDDIVIASANSSGFHRRSESDEDSEVSPACNSQTTPAVSWRLKKYRYVKGWRKPCEQFACYGRKRPALGTLDGQFQTEGGTPESE